MHDTCPQCGGEMLDDTQPGMAQTARCSACQYHCVLADDGLFLTEWSHEGTMTITNMIEQPDGTIIVKGHMPNQPESPDSCEADESPDQSEQRVNPYDLGSVARGMRRKR